MPGFLLAKHDDFDQSPLEESIDERPIRQDGESIARWEARLKHFKTKETIRKHSEWYRADPYAEEILRTFPNSELDNSIHPMFAWERFDVHPDLAVKREQYEMFLPAWRLASLLLETDVSLEFWSAMANSKRVRVLDLEAEKAMTRDTAGKHRINHIYRISRPAGGLSESDRIKIKKKLREASNLLEYNIDNTPDEASLGLCSTQVNPRWNTFSISTNKFGPMARIALSKFWIVDRIMDLRERCPERNHEAQFVVAFVLVHEIAHFLWLYFGEEDAMGCDRVEPLFEDLTFAEMGLEWECHVFGGIHTADPVGGIPPIWYEKDCPAVLSACLENVRDADRILEYSFNKAQFEWKVPMEYFAKFFRIDFWLGEVPKRGPEAFKLKKLVAVASRLYPNGDRHFLTRGNDIPEEFLMGKFFSVFPKDLQESDWPASWDKPREIVFK
jgi:hypothetical protein